MVLTNHALWQVAVKALLFRDDGKVLALTTPDGYLDFPGGRVDESERELPWSESLKREVAEELGSSVQFETGKIVFVAKRQYRGDGQTHHIAAIYFRCAYKSGDITLSDEHARYSWQTPEEILYGSQKPMSADEAAQFQWYFQK